MRVVGLGAICDLEPDAINNGREHSFRISEFALLDNGERVILHADDLRQLPYEVVLTERVVLPLSTRIPPSTDGV